MIVSASTASDIENSAMIRYLLLMLLLFPFQIYSQIYLKGCIKDKETHTPLPYSYIGIQGKSVGTMTDSLGNFEMFIPQSLENAHLTLSYMGYNNLLIALDTLTSTDYEFYLQPRPILLKEIIIQPKKFIGKKNFGTVKGKTHTFIGINHHTYATYFQVPEDTLLKLNLIRVYIGDWQDRRCSLRVRICLPDSDNTDIPGTTLNSKDIMIQPDRRYTWMESDLKDQNVWIVDSGFFVVFELIDPIRTTKTDFEPGTYTIGTTLKSKKHPEMKNLINKQHIFGYWIPSRERNTVPMLGFEVEMYKKF